MAQIFDRSSNALARMSLILTGLIVIALGVTLDELQRSPWVTRQGQRPDQPVPFSHKHHVQGLGLQCQYCHTTVEKSSYAGIPLLPWESGPDAADVRREYSPNGVVPGLPPQPGEEPPSHQPDLQHGLGSAG